MTFSIVALDKESGEAGFAIASCCWDAGQVCRAEAEAGAIASQAQGNISLLPAYFDRVGRKEAPKTILEHFKTLDDGIESRQIGMVSCQGEPIAFTGSRCAPWAGHRTGADYACQGNILVGPEVIDAMVSAYEESGGPLYRRLYAALSAGDAAGGDLRGKQSARLMIAKEGAGAPGSNTFLDIRIEDHTEPVGEIGRTLQVGETLMGILGLFREFSDAAENEKSGVLDRLREVLDDKRDPRYLDWWESLASGYGEIGDVEKAVETYRTYLSINPSMERVIRAAVEAGEISGRIASKLFE